MTRPTVPEAGPQPVERTSYWSQDATGRQIKVAIVGGWEGPFEAEFEEWSRLPWWRKLLAQFGVWR
jgi:hypothetical protein